ncbi:MAG: SusC/RagA family TonB-linked outer membrane protein, partial [Muribaculaceae bacterium]|nr:SusC/RagA family TonB-linked outer membrane protein [Muribaculaceae bacterium]
MDKAIGATELRSRLLGLFLAILLIPVSAFAQNQQTVTGTVTDETGEPLIGASVKVAGETIGTSTDFDGHYTLKIPAGAKQLTFSYVGYKDLTADITSDVIDVTMKPNAEVLDEVVVIGYGVRKKDDLTGSISTISAKDFNQGVITSPEELINGKMPGVQIVNSGGSTTGGSTIRIRGGASLNASNDPLIVIDGVPMEVGGYIEGQGNFLSMINPNDIESMTVLKDASSTAIYGSRASNGVILITTKKGKGNGIKVSFSTTNSVSTKTKTADMLSRDEFVDVIQAKGSAAQIALLGNENTDWTDHVMQTGFGTDNNLSVAGRVTDWLPFRVSLGALYQEGIMKNDENKRFSGNINLSPSFFNDDLKFTFSGKASYNASRYPSGSIIWNATTYNPTIPVYSGTDAFLGYNEPVD